MRPVGQDEKKTESAGVVLFGETLSKAKAGDVEAMTELGAMYVLGTGVIQDIIHRDALDLRGLD